MKPKEFLKAIESSFPEANTDSKKAKLLGLTPGRISQWRQVKKPLSPRQMAMVLKRATAQSQKKALASAIRPIVELYPIERVASKQDASWEVFDTKAEDHPRNYQLRKVLEGACGIYFFYNSQGEVLYTGKTEKQTLWKEINLAFNRERESNKAFMVAHPTTGSSFAPAWSKPRQPVRRVMYFHDVASFFSAYEVANEMIGTLEALVVRSICNDLSNVKMEKF